MTKRAASYDLNPELLDSDENDNVLCETKTSCRAPAVSPYTPSSLESRHKVIRLKRFLSNPNENGSQNLITKRSKEEIEQTEQEEDSKLASHKASATEPAHITGGQTMSDSVGEGDYNSSHPNLKYENATDSTCLSEKLTENPFCLSQACIPNETHSVESRDTCDAKQTLDKSLVSNEAAKVSVSECKPIFGTLFSQRFTNPFAQVAQEGEENFYTMSQSSSSLAGNHLDESLPTENHQDNEEEEPQDTSTYGVSDSPSSRVLYFPGEESDEELYVDNFVILLKCVPVDDRESTDASLSSQSETEKKYKFKRQGEGILRILEGKSVKNEEKPEPQRRIVVRQRGTWTVLLNSPLWVSKSFHIVQQLSGGYGVRFAGIDCTSSPTTTSLSIYILKFTLERQRTLFLEAIKKYQDVQ